MIQPLATWPLPACYADHIDAFKHYFCCPDETVIIDCTQDAGEPDSIGHSANPSWICGWERIGNEPSIS